MLDISIPICQEIEFVKVIAPPIATLLSAFIVVYYTYKFALKKLKQETYEAIQKGKYEQMIKANQRAWSLLRFTTDKENPNSVYSFEQNDHAKSFYFRKHNAELYLNEYANILLNEGYGLFLSKKVVALLAEFRGILFGFLLKEHNNDSDKILISNQEMISRMKAIHQELCMEIRSSIAMDEREIVI